MALRQRQASEDFPHAQPACVSSGATTHSFAYRSLARGFLAACLAALPIAGFAQPVVDWSRTEADGFYAKAGGTSNAQMLVLTNAGDLPLSIGAVQLVGAAAGDFRVGGSCANGNVTLQPWQQCVFTTTFTANAGERFAILLVNTNAPTSPDPVLLQGRLANPDATQPYAYANLSPSYVDFGVQTIATPSTATTITLTSSGSEREFTLADFHLGGWNPEDFRVTSTCQVGARIYVGNSCQFTIQFVPTGAGPRSAELYLTDPTLSASIPIALAGIGGGSQPPLVRVFEYYNASLDHYFITWKQAEINALDSGAIPGWTRTGQSFSAYAEAQPGTSPICRYRIPPALGDSHFFGRGAAECAATGQNNPSFILEDPAFMYLALPTGGVCPANTIPVYRAFDNRPDANHRYMTERNIRDYMVSRGWVAEGDGPDLVVMCAPQ
jgi:hypothetical protein